MAFFRGSQLFHIKNKWILKFAGDKSNLCHRCFDLQPFWLVDEHQNKTWLKGGGGCLAQEKIVAQFSDYFVVVADERKNSVELGTSFKYVPIEVLPLAYKPLQMEIKVLNRAALVIYS